MSGTIYALIDPVTHVVRYVGRTKDGLERPYQHLRTARPAVGAWIASLEARGLTYAVDVLERVGDSKALGAAELKWIQRGVLNGWPLLNVSGRPKLIAPSPVAPDEVRPYQIEKAEAVAQFNRKYVQRTLAREPSFTEAAKLAGMDRSNFRRLARSTAETPSELAAFK